MPELPEVEIVRRGLERLVGSGARIERFEFRRKDLRDSIPIQKLRGLEGQRLQGFERRSKYLFFRAETGGVLSHLGMTGSWRIESPAVGPKTHDHVLIHLDDQRCLVYHDPRRFGVLDWAVSLAAPHPRLNALGPEPLEASFHEGVLRVAFRGKTSPVKNLLMNPGVVVGVGNIYASEILFQAGVRPTRLAHRVTISECLSIAAFTKKILQEAIDFGGSSIRDYTQADGARGGFQNRFFVYGREGEACRRCRSTVVKKTQAGRSSFYCPRCQR